MEAICRSRQRYSTAPFGHNIGLIQLAADDTLQINANTNSADGWSDFLATLNKSLDPLDLELSRMRNETTGKEMYALVSNCSPTAPVLDCR